MAFTEELRAAVRKASSEMHELFQRGYTPKVKPSRQCKACSLEELCVPKLQKTGRVREYIKKNVAEQN